MRTSAAGSHLDPDLLAAFAEGGLQGSERQLALVHLASCADCRMVLSLACSASPATAGAVPARSTWFAWPVLRWGAAVACVAIVGAAISLYREQPRKYQASRIEAITTQLESDKVAPSKTAESAKGEQPAKSLPPQIAAEPAAAPSAPPVANKSKDQFARQDANQPSVDNLTESGDLDKKVAPAQGKAKEAVAPAEAKAAPGPSAGIAARRAESSNAVSMSLKATPRWTLAADGTLERSLDSGQTWQKIPVSSSASFRTVFALDSDVWVGGNAGSLFHSSDAGEHWSQVNVSAENRSSSGDVTAIQFADSLHGRITTSTDEVWATENGGSSWKQLW